MNMYLRSRLSIQACISACRVQYAYIMLTHWPAVVTLKAGRISYTDDVDCVYEPKLGCYWRWMLGLRGKYTSLMSAQRCILG